MSFKIDLTNVKADFFAEKAAKSKKGLRETMTAKLSGQMSEAERLDVADRIIRTVSMTDAIYTESMKSANGCVAAIDKMFEGQSLEEKYINWTKIGFGFAAFSDPALAKRLASGTSIGALFLEAYPDGVTCDGQDYAQEIQSIKDILSQAFQSDDIKQSDVAAVLAAIPKDGGYQYLGAKYGAMDAFDIRCFVAVELMNQAAAAGRTITPEEAALSACASSHLDHIKRAREAGKLGEDVANGLVFLVVGAILVSICVIGIGSALGLLEISTIGVVLYTLLGLGLASFLTDTILPLLRKLLGNAFRLVVDLLPNSKAKRPDFAPIPDKAEDVDEDVDTAEPDPAFA